MRLVRLTRLRPARLRLLAQLRLPLTNKQPRSLQLVPPQHLQLLPHPVRAPSQVQVRNRVRVHNRVRARNRVRALTRVRPRNQTLLRHRPVSNMNLETMRITDSTCRGSNLVGRGSRTAENCFRSLGRFHVPGSVRPMNMPSRGSKVCNLFRRDLRLRTICEQSSLWVRLGERFGLAHGLVAISQGPCSYQTVTREPRPTKVAVTSHLSLLTSHLSHQGYVCS
jgi:hypothetical protein